MKLKRSENPLTTLTEQARFVFPTNLYSIGL